MYGVKRVSETMTTTHEQIRLTKHDDHYRATVYVGDRLSMYSEGDTEQSARLSLLDRIITEDGEDIKLSGPIVHDLIAHANQRAKTAMITTVREAWSAIRHSDNATNINARFNAIETAAQIVYGGVEVDTKFIDGWPSLSMILSMMCDAHHPKNESEWNDPRLSSVYNRLSQMLFSCIR